MNTIANSKWVTTEVARGFVNSVVFLANVNRTYDGQYVQSGAKVGNTVQARLPQRFYAADGQAMQLQALYDQTVPISLTNQKHVAFSWSSAEETTELDNVRTRFVQPGADALANVADVLAFNAVYRDVYQSVGIPGTTPNSIQTYLNAGVRLTDSATPLSGRVAVLDTLAMATIAGTASTMFNPSATQSENYREGMFGRRQLGIEEWYQDQNRPVHTTGSFVSSTPVVVGAGQTGTILLTNGWGAAATLKKGDVFTIAGVFQVNPQSYASVGRQQQFVATSDATESGGNMTLNISPPIIPGPSQLQTVTNAPAAGAAIQVLGSAVAVAPATTLTSTVSPQSFVYHPDAFAFVMADLIKPGAGAKSSVARSKQYGFSVRMVEQYQIGSDQNPTRLDILIGAATLQARLATRVWG